MYLYVTVCAIVLSLHGFQLVRYLKYPPFSISSMTRMHNVASVSASLGSMGMLRLFGVSWPWSLAAGLGVYLGTRTWKYFYIAARTAKRDLK